MKTIVNLEADLLKRVKIFGYDFSIYSLDWEHFLFVFPDFRDGGENTYIGSDVDLVGKYGYIYTAVNRIPHSISEKKYDVMDKAIEELENALRFFDDSKYEEGCKILFQKMVKNDPILGSFWLAVCEDGAILKGVRRDHYEFEEVISPEFTSDTLSEKEIKALRKVALLEERRFFGEVK